MAGASDSGAVQSRARILSKTLEELTNEFNSVIESAEDAIRNLRLGVPGRTLLEKWEDEQRVTRYRFLHFMKYDKTWRLMVEYTDEFNDDGEGGSFEPLLNASRDLRLRAMQVLPDLIEDMMNTAATEIVEVKTAIDMARAFVSNIVTHERKGK